MDFIIINGEIEKNNEVNLTPFFGDNPLILTQKVWFGYGGIPLLDKNIDLLLVQIKLLKLDSPKILQNKRELFRITKRMLNKNKRYRSGIITINLFFKNSRINSVISSSPFSDFEFPVPEAGVLVNFSELKKLSSNPFNRFAFSNKSNWEIVETQLKGTQFQNSIFLNEKNRICDVPFSNIYAVKDKFLFTPSLETGSYEDSLRSIILENAKSIPMTVIESKSIKKEVLFEMDEIFLASEAGGIQWILGIENKRFMRNYSVQIHEKVNVFLAEKVKGRRSHL